MQNIFCPNIIRCGIEMHPTGDYCFESTLFIEIRLPTGI